MIPLHPDPLPPWEGGRGCREWGDGKRDILSAPAPQSGCAEGWYRLKRKSVLGNGIIQSRGLSLPEPPYDRADLIDTLFGKVVESTLIQPTFVMDYPAEISPLARRHRKGPTVTERFELIVAGKEIANAYSELNDLIDQRERLLWQAALREAGGLEAMLMDEDFLRALEYGMPPTARLGLGIDCLTMLLTDAPSIQEVILFPLLRPENKPTPHTT
jgi:lysyl-tRNA synthetase class 2